MNHFRLARCSRLLLCTLLLLLGFNSSSVFAQQSFPVSVNTTNTATANGFSIRSRVNSNGRFIVFQSTARDLVPTSDTNGTFDVFVRDLQTNQTTLVSRSITGNAAANAQSERPSISADGRFIAFESLATNLTADPDTTNTWDVFVRDMQSGTTTLVSRNNAGTATGNNQSVQPVISAQGNVVVFLSDATDLTAAVDTNNEVDLFARNLTTNTTSLVTINRAGETSANGRGIVDATTQPLSADGRFVMFSSIASDLATDATIADTNASRDVFVRDIQSNTTRLVSIDATNTTSGNGNSTLGSITSDGRYVVFNSSASNLTANDSNNFVDAFVRDVQTNSTILISLNATNTNSGNNSSFVQPSSGSAVGNNGRYVVFMSFATDLTDDSEDNASSDVFVRDLQSGTTKLIKGDSSFASISADGRFIMFENRGSYFARDGNSYIYEDIYVHDLSIGTTSLVSDGLYPPYSNSTPPNPSSYNVFATGSISSDGSVIAFDSNAPTLRTRDDNNQSDTFAYRTNIAATTGIFINDVRVQEGGQEETRSLDFTISLSVPSTSTVTVDYRTSSFDASATTDYRAERDTLTFAPGETSKTVSIAVFGDDDYELDESLDIILSNASANAVIGKTVGTGTIVNDDAPTRNVPAKVLISEFRTRGTAGAADDFVELYNNSDAAIDVNRWRVVTVDANGNQGFFGRVSTRGVIIPARGYLLFAGRDYSLRSSTLR